MKLACWNVRGLNRPLKQRSVRTICGTHRIDVFGILESKFDTKALDAMMSIRFQGMLAVNNFSYGGKGRICVVWNPSRVKLDVIDMGFQHLHLRFGWVCIS